MSAVIDKIRIEQVITNILLNAIKNTPPNGKITIELSEEEDWVEISVTDTGIGLTEEEMSIIFTRHKGSKFVVKLPLKEQIYY